VDVRTSYILSVTCYKSNCIGKEKKKKEKKSVKISVSGLPIFFRISLERSWYLLLFYIYVYCIFRAKFSGVLSIYFSYFL